MTTAHVNVVVDGDNKLINEARLLTLGETAAALYDLVEVKYFDYDGEHDSGMHRVRFAARAEMLAITLNRFLDYLDALGATWRWEWDYSDTWSAQRPNWYLP